MNIAILFAGGSGSRMNSRELPKQFLSVHGRPVITQTAKLFQDHEAIDCIVVSCIEEWINYCAKVLEEARITKVCSIVPGGQTSQESIYNALKVASNIADSQDSMVLIHDGVRPLIDSATISVNIESVKSYGSAITCVEAKETLVTTEDGEIISDVTDRRTMRVARAPQSFWLKDILNAHEQAIAEGRNDYIDSASLMHRYGYPLHIVMGPNENIKLTTPDDYYAIQAILNSRENRQLYEEYQ